MTKAVVPDKEVEFSEGSGRPDAVTEATTALAVPSPSSANAASIGLYLKAVCKNVGLQLDRSINLTGLDQCMDFIGFNDRLALVAKPIPRRKYIEVLAHHDPDLAYVLSHTDFEETFPDTLALTDSLPISMENHFHLQESWDVPNRLQNALQAILPCFAIPDQRWLSLFIENGEVLNKYLAYSKYTSPEQPLWVTYVNPESNVVSRNGLIPVLRLDVAKVRAFVDETGTRNWVNMMRDAETLREELAVGVPLQRKILAQRLKKYHPELTV